MEHLPRLPCACTVCAASASTQSVRPMQIVPDRAVGSWRFDVMCPLCFDEFLGCFHGIFLQLRRREVLGRWPARRVSR